MKIEIKLKEIRRENKITLNELARITGISKTHLNDIENNLKVPSIYIMELLSRTLKVDIKDLYEMKL